MNSQQNALTIEPVDESMDPHATQADADSPRGPTRFSFATGSRPLDGYTIKRGIGRGGFGEVYFAVSDGGKEVAIKLIRHNLDVELRGVTHCLNLKHANLIALYDVKQDDQDNTCVVREYATGEPLEDVVRRSPNGLHPEEAVRWMEGIAAGVGYLHDHGIVHRDLKPGNIFLDEGQVKLGDYGLSKFISCSRRSGQTESIGTVHYMAPEVANGRYGKEIDIYALGIILFEMLTGHVPFEGESVGEVLMKHLTAEPTLGDVPEDYRAVISRAMAKDPHTRFASVAELMDALPPLAATRAHRPPLHETRHAGDPAASANPASSNTSGADGARGFQAAAAMGGAAAVGAGAAAAMGGAAAAEAGDTVQAALVDEEPIWRAIRDGWRTTRNSWDGFNTPTKITMVVLGIVVMFNPATWSFALRYLPPLVLLYVIYRVVRSVVISQDARNRPGGAAGTSGSMPYQPPYRAAGAAPRQVARPQPAETQYHPQTSDVPMGDWRSASRRHWKKKHRRARHQWSEEDSTTLVLKPPRERITDLLGSMIMAAIVGMTMSIVVILLRGEMVDNSQFAWLSLTSVLGSWAVLLPSKIWEGRDGEAILRRVVLLMIGLAVGGAAWASSDALMVKFPDSPMPHIVDARNVGAGFYDATDGSPQLPAFLAYFGALFFVVGWWKQANPLRRTRLSIWSTAVAVLVAWLITCVWPFPQPWGLMVAAIMAVSVQLVSPYVPPQERVAATAGGEA